MRLGDLLIGLPPHHLTESSRATKTEAFVQQSHRYIQQDRHQFLVADADIRQSDGRYVSLFHSSLYRFTGLLASTFLAAYASGSSVDC
jgi:hypothetical protein